MRYLQIIDGVATSEVESSGALPPVVAECMDCIADSTIQTGQTWNPQVDAPDGLDAWLTLHKGHNTRMKTIVEVSDTPSAELGMAYDVASDVFTDVDQVMRATGFTPQRISTHAIEDEIAGRPRVVIEVEASDVLE